MNTELKKKIDEAVNKHVFSLPLPSIERVWCVEDDFLAGTELGYREAIKVAKEWLEGHWDITDYNSIDEFVADFEAEMNKLLEEKE